MRFTGIARVLRDMSVRTKLFAAFGGVLLLLLSVAVAGELSNQTLFAATRQLGNGTEPRVEAAEQVQFDLANTYGFQTAYVLGERAMQRQSFETALAQVRADLRTLASYATNERYKGALAQMNSGLHGFLALDRVAWADVNSGHATLIARAQRITLDTELKPYTQLLSGATAYLNHAKRDQAGALASADRAHSLATLLAVLISAVALLLGAALALVVSRSIKRSVDLVLERMASLRDHCATSLTAGIHALSQGDLTVAVESVTPAIENPSKDELGQVGEAVNGVRDRIVTTIAAYNQTRAQLTDLVGRVSGSASQVSAASQEMAATSDESGRAIGEIANAVAGIAHGAERQVQAIEHARTAAEEVGQAASTAADSAQRTADVAREAREAAQHGVGAAEQADHAMRSVRDSSAEVSEAIQGLAAKSEQIGQIVRTITGIAEQTNLLALNAAIEAARAGEQGRGFAVVAEEVRKLAEEAQHAAQEISGLVGAIQSETGRAVEVVDVGTKRTQDGAEVVEKTREAFLRIGSSVDDMADRIEQIASATEQIAASAQTMQQNVSEVAAVAEQSSASTEEVSASTEQTSASAQQIAASAQELAGSAQLLQGLVDRFKLRSEAV